MTYVKDRICEICLAAVREESGVNGGDKGLKPKRRRNAQCAKSSLIVAIVEPGPESCTLASSSTRKKKRDLLHRRPFQHLQSKWAAPPQL